MESMYPACCQMIYAGASNVGAVDEVSVKLELVLRLSRPGDLVLDPFAGAAAGSCGRACLRTGRGWVGFEGGCGETVKRATLAVLTNQVKSLVSRGILGGSGEPDPERGGVVHPTEAQWKRLAGVLERRQRIPMKVAAFVGLESESKEKRLEADVAITCGGKVRVVEVTFADGTKMFGLEAAEDLPADTIVGYYHGDLVNRAGLLQLALEQNKEPYDMERRVPVEWLSELSLMLSVLPEVVGREDCAVSYMNCARGPGGSKNAGEDVGPCVP